MKKEHHTFNEYFEALNDYLKLHNGKYPPSYGGFHNGLYVGCWIQKIRNIYMNGEIQQDNSIKSKCGILTNEQVNKLNSINFKWIVKYDVLYKKEFNKDKKYEAIKRYLTEELNRLLYEYEDIELNQENLKKINHDYKLILTK